MDNIEGFSSLGLSETMLRALSAKGFEEPTEIQREAIPLLMEEGTEIVGQAQTGTGKTAAFAIPILETVSEKSKLPEALVLVPTRELAVQVSEEINSLRGERKTRAVPVYGGASMAAQLKALERGAQIVVGTPGRILDHIRRGSLDLSCLAFLVLDEADEMLDMGFIEDIEAVLRAVPSEKRMLMFSATMPPEIMKLAEGFMKDPVIIRTQKQETPVETADQIYYEVREADKLEALMRIIDREESFYGVVFCRTKLQCDEIGTKLQDRGYDAAALHGDLSQREREAILHKMKEHQLSVLVATDVAARGLDIQDLTHVINYALPSDPEIYIHRVGRTGRAGKNGTAITFITPSEARKFSFIRRASRSDIRKEEVPAAEEVIESKRQRIQKSAEELLSGPVKTEYLELAARLLEGRNAEETVANLLGAIYKNELDISRYREIRAITPEKKADRKKDRRQAREDEPRMRLYVARGRKDGLTKSMLVNVLSDTANIRGDYIEDIEIKEDSSFISVPASIGDIILSSYSDRKSKGKPVVTRAKPEVRPGARSPRKKSANSQTARKRRQDWEEDFQPYGRDTRDGEEEAKYSFPEKHRKKGKGRK